jgi:hypothetical protein
MMRFRDFIEAEMAAAPAMGQGPAAPNPGAASSPIKPGRNDVRVGWGEFDIDPEDGEEALRHGEPIMSFTGLNVPGHGIVPSGPEPISFDDDGKAKAMYSVMNRNKMQNPNGTKYHGTVRDQRLPLGNRNRPGRKNVSIDDIILGPWAASQQGGGMPPPPPPGAPPGAPGGM